MLYLLVTLLQLIMIEASHYRGGTVSWRHVKSYEGVVEEIEIYFRVGWRLDHSSPQCDNTYIVDQEPIYSYGDLWSVDTWTSLVASSAHSIEMKCTTFDPVQNWAYGFNSFRANVSDIRSFTIRFTGSPWISTLLVGGGDWSLEAFNKIPGERSDTGNFNRPPSTFSAPIVRLQRGCPSDIVITLNDDDSDNVFCRLGTGFRECGGVCELYEHLSLNETTCIIHYDGGGGIGLAAVAILLEDFPVESILIGGITVTPSESMSLVPLQFLVEIVDTTSCNVRPLIPPASIPEGATYVLPESEFFNQTIYAYPSAPGLSITLFIILGPLGVHQSEIFYIGNDTFIAHVTWRPTQDQIGRHDVCYYAVDDDGKTSEQKCFQITVTEALVNSCEVDNGGCSDICIPSGATNVCECFNSCWQLDSHGKTCVPLTNITCSGNEIEIFVDKCSTNKTIVAGTSLEYFSHSHCQSIEKSSGYELKFTPDQCGTGLELSATGVNYNVYMWTWEDFENNPDGSSVVRGEWRIVRLSCSLPSSQNLTASFLPLPALNEEIVPETLVIDGFGSFLLYFDFYRSQKFLSSYTTYEYPLSVALDQNIYIELRAEGRAGLELFVERCVAMSTPTITPDTLSYALIENGCIADETTIRYASDNAMQSRFSFQAFEFESNLLLTRSNAAAFINCQIVMCDVASNNTRCKQGCIDGSRRKRSSDGEPKANEFIDNDDDSFVTSSPQTPPSEITRQINFIFPDENSPKTSNDNIKWIMIGVGGLVLLIALCLIYRIVLARQHFAQKSSSSLHSKLNHGFDFESTVAT